MTKKEISLQEQISKLRAKLSQEKRALAEKERKKRDRARYIIGGALINILSNNYKDDKEGLERQVSTIIHDKDSNDYAMVIQAVMYEIARIKKCQEGRTQS